MNKNGGPISPARFVFQIAGYPNTMRNMTKYRQHGSNFMRDLQFLCESAELPGLTLQTFERAGYSAAMQTHMPGKLDYSPFTTSFICRDYMREKEFFDDWMFSIKNTFQRNGPGGVGPTFDNAYYNDIVVDGAIFAISQYNGADEDDDIALAQQNRYAVRIANMYPTSIDSINLNWAEEAAMKLNVTFTYAYWEPIIGASLVAQSQGGDSQATYPTYQLLNYVIPRDSKG